MCDVQMAVPLLTTKIVKKRVKHFKRHHSDRYIGLKVRPNPSSFLSITLKLLVDSLV